MFEDFITGCNTISRQHMKGGRIAALMCILEVAQIWMYILAIGNANNRASQIKVIK